MLYNAQCDSTKPKTGEPSTVSIYCVIKDPVLSIMHCVLQKSMAIFLMWKNPLGLIALCNPFASALSFIKRFTLFIRQHLRTYFNIASLKRPEVQDVIISFHAIEC